jgi:hypothetical protein
MPEAVETVAMLTAQLLVGSILGQFADYITSLAQFSAFGYWTSHSKMDDAGRIFFPLLVGSTALVGIYYVGDEIAAPIIGATQGAPGMVMVAAALWNMPTFMGIITAAGKTVVRPTEVPVENLWAWIFGGP